MINKLKLLFLLALFLFGSVTSTISAIDDLTKKREENRKKRDAANDALRKVPDDPRLPNIEKDPEEKINWADEHPDIVKRLLEAHKSQL